MSDSDDTDILLLIPPDFFAVHNSDSEDSFRGERYSDTDLDLVTGLISQVCNLEDRLSIIESKESLATPLTNKTEDMSQPTWHNLNASTPRSRSSRATSLPPTPSSMGGPPVYHRMNSYPSPAKSVPSPDRNSYYGKSVFNRNGPQGSPSAHSANGDVSDFRVRNYVAQLPSRRDPKQAARLKNAETMKEIDSFFDNLRERYGKRETLSAPGPSSQVQNLGLEEVDRLLEKVEADQQQMEVKLSARERQFGLPVGEEVAKETRIKSFPGDSISSVPDLGHGVRKLWDDKAGQPPPKRASAPSNGVSKPDDGGVVEEVCTQKKYGLLTKDANGRDSEGSQGSKVFHSRRRLDLENSNRPDFARLPDEGNKSVLDLSSDLESAVLQGGPLSRPMDYSISPETTPGKSGDSPTMPQHYRREQQSKGQRKGLQDNLGMPASVAAGPPPIPPLMSLADLWDGKKSSQSLTLEQRLEEEKCRREHCESLVQSLQSRLLEAQQRLAVAQRVDSEKDAALKHLHSTWSKIMDAWRGLEEERDALAAELDAARGGAAKEKEQLGQRLAKAEGELSKALDLAHGYKEQSEVAERTRAEQLEQLVDKVKEVERRLAAATQANSEAQARETELRDKLAEETERTANLTKTLTTVNKSLTQREADVAILTEEKNSLQTRLKEERARGDTLQQSRDSIRKEAEDAGKRERTLQAEVRQLNQQLSSIRSELRDFYQEQLERAVRDKLSEFQGQLDAAETALHREAENRELAMAELAARQLKQLNTKHKQEVALLEQRHAEELHLAQLQKTEAEQNVAELRKRLEEHEANASHLAQRLHGIMQNQWREALSVVSVPKAKSGGKATSQSEKAESVGGGDIGGGQSWLLVKQQEQQERRRQRQQKQQQESNFHSLPTKWSSNDEAPFEQEGLLTQRSTSTSKAPLQASNSSGDSGEDLKKYIKMLLDRAPGRPIETTSAQGADSLKGGKLSDKVSTPNGRESRNSGGKPPWK